jgi:hypothetical protein
MLRLVRMCMITEPQMEFSYGTKKWRPVGEYMTASKEAENVDPKVMEFALGLHAPGRFDKVLPIDHCLLQHDISNQVKLSLHSPNCFVQQVICQVQVFLTD